MDSTNWSIPCIADNEDLEPSPEELETMYQKLESGSLLDLQWKCPGRRRIPTPPSAVETEVPVTPDKEMFVFYKTTSQLCIIFRHHLQNK